jgi:deazaflavin-dependent oxidoreductase (nitroreductase family)
MTSHIDGTATVPKAPRWVRFPDRLVKFLIARRAPLGFNALVTIRGRTTGEPRTTPLAVIDVAGRRWVWSPWGDVNWVRNLRAAGRATITTRGREEDVRATELDPAERVAFFRDVLRPVAHEMRGGVAFVRIVDGVDVDRPEEEAAGRCVFELFADTDTP